MRLVGTLGVSNSARPADDGSVIGRKDRYFQRNRRTEPANKRSPEVWSSKWGQEMGERTMYLRKRGKIIGGGLSGL